LFVCVTKKRKKMKRTHSQSSPDGFVENALHDAAESPDIKRTRTAPDGCTEEEEEDWDQVCGIIQALQAKPEWQRKVADQAIVAKWRAEALAQGASPRSVTEALALLLQEAVVGADGTAGHLPSAAHCRSRRRRSARGWWVETATLGARRMMNADGPRAMCAGAMGWCRRSCGHHSRPSSTPSPLRPTKTSTPAPTTRYTELLILLIYLFSN